MGVMTSQITSLTIVYSIVYSGADQRKHQSSASLAFLREFPAQMANNAENVSIWWRHHGNEQYVCDLMTSVYDNIEWTILSLGIVSVDRGDDLRLILNHKHIKLLTMYIKRQEFEHAMTKSMSYRLMVQWRFRGHTWENRTLPNTIGYLTFTWVYNPLCVTTTVNHASGEVQRKVAISFQSKSRWQLRSSLNSSEWIFYRNTFAAAQCNVDGCISPQKFYIRQCVVHYRALLLSDLPTSPRFISL